MKKHNIEQTGFPGELCGIKRYPVGFRRIMILFAFLVLAEFVYSQQYPFTLNFEERELIGWDWKKDTSNAFYYQPTYGDNPTERQRGQPSNHQGNYWIGTYEKYQGLDNQRPGTYRGDWPQGDLTSPYFTIPQGILSFLVGGGSKFETRVELLIRDPADQIEQQDRMVLYASGRDSETMRRDTWDLTPYAGKTGRLRIVDNSSEGWGHINVDDFIFTLPESTRHDTSVILTHSGYKVFLSADLNQPEPGKTVKWMATLEPVNVTTEYRFVFGDGKIREWSEENIAEHIYSDPGDYTAFVEVRLSQRMMTLTHRIDQGTIAVSEPYLISVKSPPSNEWWWWLLIIGLPLVIAGSYFLSRNKKQKRTAQDHPMKMQIIPHAETGDQRIESAGAHHSDYELRFKPVADPGDQYIIDESSLIISERRNVSDER